MDHEGINQEKREEVFIVVYIYHAPSVSKDFLEERVYINCIVW